MMMNNERTFTGRILKKSLIFLVAVLVAFTVSACRRDEEDNDENGNDKPPEELRKVTDTRLVLFEGPRMMDSSDMVEVFVEDEEVFVYETRINHGRTFSYTYPDTHAPVALFDFEGAVEVRLVIPDETEIESAVVRPLAHGVEPTIEGNTITFTLEYPTSYVIEYNDDPDTAIHLFTNVPEEETPDSDHIPDDMIYLGPGIHKADAIPVESGMTVYIAGGAVVYGQIRTEYLEDVTIKGRGIIDGSIYERRRAAEYTIPIEFRHSENMRIEGITFLDSAGWTIASYFVDGLVIDNINIMTARANGDGISIQSSHNVHVKNSFVRTWDDSLVVKNYNRGTTSNVTFENMTLWTDLAQSMEIGYETYGETIENVTFRDITVLHNFHKPVISIHNADDAHISNIRYENITVENARIRGDNPGSVHDNFFFDFQIAYNMEWTSSGGTRGTIDDVIVDNVVVLDGKDDVVSRISGDNPNNRITNVSINNVTYNGRAIETPEDLDFSINQHTRNIDFSHNPEASTGARLLLPYELALETDDVTIEMRESIDQDGFLIPDFAIGEVPTLYMGNRVEGDFTIQATHGTSLLEWDDGSGPFEKEGKEAEYALDNDKDTRWEAPAFPTEDPRHFAALSVFFDDDYQLGTVRIQGDADSMVYQLQNIAIFAIRSTSTADTFVKLTNSEDFEFSPASGNYVDINISPGEYRAIQIRFHNVSGPASPDSPFVTNVEFYPASLSFNKPVSASPHEDVYDASNITDGNRMTYYESRKGEWPAEVVIDLMDSYDINYITLYLPPLMLWEPREQEVEIRISQDGVNYEELLPPTYYRFDPVDGNVVEIELSEAATAQYVKFIFTDNTSPGGYGAQISQINIFE